MTDADGSRAQLLEQLRGYLGEFILLDGERLALQDLIVAEALLVFRQCGVAHQLQADLHGEARRRTPTLRELPAFRDDGAPSEATVALLRQAGPRA